MQKGYTLLEVIVVLGILAFIFSLGLLVSFDSYRGYTLRSERDVVADLLMRARSRAVNNIRQAPWGVCLRGNEYVLFRGIDCALGVSGNETTTMSPAATVTFANPIVFAQLSGTTTGGQITVLQDNRTATITVNAEGMVDW